MQTLSPFSPVRSSASSSRLVERVHLGWFPGGWRWRRRPREKCGRRSHATVLFSWKMRQEIAETKEASLPPSLFLSLPLYLPLSVLAMQIDETCARLARGKKPDEAHRATGTRRRRPMPNTLGSGVATVDNLKRWRVSKEGVE